MVVQTRILAAWKKGCTMKNTPPTLSNAEDAIFIIQKRIDLMQSDPFIILLQSVWDITYTCQIIQRYTIILSKLDHVVQWNFLRTAFIPRILLLLHSQKIGNLGLRFVGILSHILDPTIYVHEKPSYHDPLLINKLYPNFQKSIDFTTYLLYNKHRWKYNSELSPNEGYDIKA